MSSIQDDRDKDEDITTHNNSNDDDVNDDDDEHLLSNNNNNNNNNNSISSEDEKIKKKKRKPHKINLEELESDFNANLKRRGVVYLARVPPRMGPAKVKTLFCQFGEVTRVYLVEEDKAARKRRRKASGGSAQGKRYIEGWVEFAEKKVAKSVGIELNNTPISNRKRDVHFGELWSLKYLNKFMWSHLTEKVAYERRVREQRLRVEMMQAKREHAAYAHLVEAGQVLDRIQERRARRGDNVTSVEDKKRKRFVRQTLPVDDDGIAIANNNGHRHENTKRKVSKALLSSLV